ncbi:WD40 repeat domain-containing protein [Ameyamaea chiangmaiensis]|uniref:WD40 repeat domain-containing protein n=1 Tax=Ameyamaea chiangmaiensis TaxID=442969 RepID=A0A850PE39_9PROT|nr:WD40 repeat domain-containing protein [Ameyamaea chiangmaiensis]MBS4076371.1 WD40 repeat domain-containing protein [Ameyamaea chiangmaiensis]NVN40526.1 WD40 repeat domain-containing protein [Ameyamaea chiangmaiensis]
MMSFTFPVRFLSYWNVYEAASNIIDRFFRQTKVNPMSLRVVNSFKIEAPCQALAISPDGARLAFYQNFGSGILVYKTDGAYDQYFKRGGTDASLNIAFISDEKIVTRPASKHEFDSIGEIWNINPRHPTQLLASCSTNPEMARRAASKLAVSDLRKTLLLASARSNICNINVFDAETFSVRTPTVNPLNGIVGSIAASDTNGLIAVGMVGGDIYFLSINNLDIVKIIEDFFTHEISFGSLEFSPDGDHICIGRGLSTSDLKSRAPGGLSLLNIRDGRIFFNYDTHGIGVKCISWSFDSRYFAALISKSCHLFRITDAGLVEKEGEIRDVTAMKFSTKGNTLFCLNTNTVVHYELPARI